MEKSPREKFDDTEKRERLLAEVEDILRTMPSQGDFTEDHDNAAPWIGRAAAAIQRWDVTYRMACQEAIRLLSSSTFVGSSCRALVRLLHQARADLRMEIGQQISMVIPSGNVFDYFDELRKVIETARSEVFFVDAYLDAEFVPRYLPHVAKGVPIRLFGGPKKMATLLSSVDLFVKQSGTPITVRSSDKLHDRYLFVDRSECYLSGASFKDGAKNAPAVLTQITDGFQGMWDTYDNLWNSGNVER